jgi:hypothetical protein
MSPKTILEERYFNSNTEPAKIQKFSVDLLLAVILTRWFGYGNFARECVVLDIWGQLVKGLKRGISDGLASFRPSSPPPSPLASSGRYARKPHIGTRSRHIWYEMAAGEGAWRGRRWCTGAQRRRRRRVRGDVLLAKFLPMFFFARLLK